jgi:prefoldin beta subunit
MTEKISEGTHGKIQELQLLQQRLQVFAAQKQQLQLQQIETEGALAELETAKPPVYRMVGELLVEKPIADLKKELKERKEEIELRIKTVEKQELKSREKAQELQKEITTAMKK